MKRWTLADLADEIGDFAKAYERMETEIESLKINVECLLEQNELLKRDLAEAQRMDNDWLIPTNAP